MIVVDASAVLEVLLNTYSAELILELIFAEGETLHAPHLLDLEIAQVLRRYTLSGDLSEERGMEALEDFEALPITRYAHDFLLQRIWELRHNATAYDAAYLALAEAMDAPLITRDEALASIAGCRARIQLV